MGIINNEDKIEFLQNYINGIQNSINILEEDIIVEPFYEVEGKPSRQIILADLISQKAKLLNKIESLKQ